MSALRSDLLRESDNPGRFVGTTDKVLNRGHFVAVSDLSLES